MYVACCRSQDMGFLQTCPFHHLKSSAQFQSAMPYLFFDKLYEGHRILDKEDSKRQTYSHVHSFFLSDRALTY